MKILLRLISITGLCLFIISNATAKETIGWLEKIAISKKNLQFKAKIDTGATTSSIHAKILNQFTKNDLDMVRFEITTTDGESVVLEREVKRITTIKRKRAISIERPVVILGICIGNTYKEEEINLSNRANFNYPVLIGRNYLSGDFLVDSEVTFTTKPRCKI